MSHRGRFNAIMPFLGGFGWALATPVGGSIIHSRGISALWLTMFGVAAAASVGLVVLDRVETRRTMRKNIKTSEDL
jgi:MFS family permease